CALAGGLYLAFADNGPSLLLGLDSRGGESLKTIRAFLHHAAGPDGDVRVAPELQDRRRQVVVFQEVEPADLVRAVVAAIPGADAAVIDHHVQALGVVQGRRDGTDDLARGL